MQKSVKITLTSLAAVAIAVPIAYFATQAERTQFKLMEKSLNGPAQPQSYARTACDNLNDVIIENFNEIIEKGVYNPKYQTWVNNIETNSNAMDMNRCSKESLVLYIQKTLPMENRLYFELQHMIE